MSRKPVSDYGFNRSLTMLTLCAILFVGLSSVSAQTCQQEVNCKLPDCFCPTFDHPLGKENVPQIVYFGFDDAVNTQVSGWYDQLFTTSRKNPNGCPITMSLYVQDQYTEYDRVTTYHKAGHEIGVHSVTHTNIDTAAKLMEEGRQQKLNIETKAGIPAADVVGWRSPNLKTAGDDQPRVLKELSYMYDISLTYARDVSNPWPFTLDYGYPYPCSVQPCPTTNHPGFWEVMVHALQDDVAGRPCVYVDACTPEGQAGAEEYLWSNFLHTYETNRAPFGLNMHAAWFARPEYLAAMGSFIDRLLNLPDVYIVNVRQMMDWMRAPVPVSEISSFAPWGCTGRHVHTSGAHSPYHRPAHHVTPRPPPTWTHRPTARPTRRTTPYHRRTFKTYPPWRPNTTARPYRTWAPWTRRPTTARPTHAPTHAPTTTRPTTPVPTRVIPFWYQQPTKGPLTYPLTGNENNNTPMASLHDIMSYIQNHGSHTLRPSVTTAAPAPASIGHWAGQGQASIHSQGQVSIPNQGQGRQQGIDGARCVQGINCHLPDCLCRSTTPPAHLSSATPQIIYIAIDAVIDGNTYASLGDIFNGERKNPNGCPISATVFVPSTGNFPPYMTALKSKGVRVGSRGGTYRGQFSGWTLRSKVSQEINTLRSQTSSGTGWRGLANMAPTDDVFQTLVEDEVPYDSSVISADAAMPWPYTLDFGLGDKCAVRQSTCPSGRYPGLWEVPIKSLVMPGDSSRSCTFPDTCPGTRNSAPFVKQLLEDNFQRHYHGDRAPFGINLHSTWFSNALKKDSLHGLANFLDSVLKNEDVVVLSIEQMLETITLPGKHIDC